MEPSILVIGGGLAGLSTGCYGRMNGYRTTVFETHSLPGGVCTGWKRNGYTIDGAVNWVMGTTPGSSYYRVWRELGVADNWSIHNHERVMVVENREGRAISFYSDADRLERHLLEIAPEDRTPIREFANAIRRSSRFSMDQEKPPELYGFRDLLTAAKMFPLLRFMKKWSSITVGSFVARLKNPFLKEAFLLAFGSEAGAGWPMSMLIMMLGFHHSKLAGYIIGGALPLARAIEQRLLDLGGEIHYEARVAKILVEEGRAVGVRLIDGREFRGDWVVSAADGRTTIFDMLEGKYLDRSITERYRNPKLFAPLVYVGLGVKHSRTDLPWSMGGVTYPLDVPITIAGTKEQLMTVRSYGFDPTLAPEGKDVLVVQFTTDYDYWDELHRDPSRYKDEKTRIAREVVEGLEQRFPGIARDIEMTDVATPVTWVRYTGNWRGSYEGWMFDASSLTSTMKKSLPGLDHFYMAGQWVNPGGGIPTAVTSGNHTLQLICNRDRRPFVTSVPERSEPSPVPMGA